MAMRITTKMMQNTSLRNINTNKAKQEDLTNQLATGKKISRPSDDPVVAIRALKLNSQLDKIDQYYEKNAEDAESWLDLTASSISTVSDILTDMKKNINQAVNSYQEASDRKAIITNLQECIEEIYSVGNSDSGGRSIFTGYRTDMSLTVQADKTEKNTITEQLTNSAIISKTYVATGSLKEINDGNFAGIGTTEYDVSTEDYYRIRLSYDELDNDSDVTVGYMTDSNTVSGDTTVNLSLGDVPEYEFSVKVNTDNNTIEISGSSTNIAGAKWNGGVSSTLTIKKGASASDNILRDANGNSLGTFSVEYSSDGKISIKCINTGVLSNTNGTTINETVSISANVTTGADGKKSVEFDDKYMNSWSVSSGAITAVDTDSDAMYADVSDNPDSMYYVADSGEIILGSSIQERLSKLSSDTELRVTYDKTDWKEGDLDPVHYFYTLRETTQNGKTKTIEYNASFLDDPSASGKQIIEYDIGNNQSIRVNTTADEVFTHDMGRDADEVIEMLNEYSSLDDALTNVQNLIDSEKYGKEDDDDPSDEMQKLIAQKAALNKALTYVGDKITSRCSTLLTDCDNYAERTQLAETNCGSRGTRLTLIKNRLNVQQTNFEELVSENEDADYTDLAIQLKSVAMTYEAALSSISYVMQTTLLDFI